MSGRRGPGCTRGQVNRALLGLGAALAGCAPAARAPGPDAAAGDGAIPLGAAARLRIALVSDQQDTVFTVSGTGAEGRDVVFPRCSLVRLLLPRVNVTVVAVAPCFPARTHFVQAGILQDGGEIGFAFSNYDREAGCKPSRLQASPTPAAASPGRLAWVIGQQRYGTGWDDLGIAAADREGMMRAFRGAGYRTSLSADRGRAGLLEDAGVFRSALRQGRPDLAIIYVSGHGVSLAGRNYLVPADAPDPAAVRPDDLLAFEEFADMLEPVVAAGGTAVLLVDACRASVGAGLRSLAAEPPRRVLVNHSTGPGGVSYNGDRGLSAWTQRFVSVAEDVPDAGIDQILHYANRYTRWESEASARVQRPVLYGRPAVPPPAFAAGPVPARAGILPRLPA